MTANYKAFVVGASEEDLANVQQCLSDWECKRVPLDEPETAVSSIPPDAKLFIVYARKETNETMTICEQLRASPEGSAVPILMVVGRYGIPQGSAIERMGNATFIISPFDDTAMCDCVAQFLK